MVPAAALALLPLLACIIIGSRQAAGDPCDLFPPPAVALSYSEIRDTDDYFRLYSVYKGKQAGFYGKGKPSKGFIVQQQANFFPQQQQIQSFNNIDNAPLNVLPEPDSSSEESGEESEPQTYEVWKVSTPANAAKLDVGTISAGSYVRPAILDLSDDRLANVTVYERSGYRKTVDVTEMHIVEPGNWYLLTVYTRAMAPEPDGNLMLCKRHSVHYAARQRHTSLLASANHLVQSRLVHGYADRAAVLYSVGPLPTDGIVLQARLHRAPKDEQRCTLSRLTMGPVDAKNVTLEPFTAALVDFDLTGPGYHPKMKWIIRTHARIRLAQPEGAYLDVDLGVVTTDTLDDCDYRLENE